MSRVVALIPDLLFGSQVQGMLGAAGHDVVLVGAEAALRRELPAADVLVADLTAGTGPADVLERLRGEGALGSTRTLAFYAHVDAAVRERAQQAGFDMVVPRSRMAREGAQLVGGLAGS